MSSTYEPIFIICTGRSGSTLLRYIMDSHELIDAPQELHLGLMIKEMTRVMKLLHEGRVNEQEDLKEIVGREVNLKIDTLMRTTLKKKIWCDKSISSIDYLDEIMSVFPKARYIFLYRDCLDFVHSALEVSKYGFNGYYFEKYILQNPVNIVDGLVNFWCLQTEKRIDIKKQSKHLIHSVKYEDIVKNPRTTLDSLFSFLKLSFDEKILDEVFVKFRAGKGDLKVQSASGIKDMTGKGRDVPLKHVKENSFERMNRVLKQIGYSEIDRNYNFTADGVSKLEEFDEDSIDRLYTFLSNSMENKTVPSAIRNHKVSIEIPGLPEGPWVLDLLNGKIARNQNHVEGISIKMKVRIDSLLKIVDKKLNISLAYREGMIKTNGTHQQLNEIGKFLFG